MSDSFATPWTAAHQALLSMGFSRKEYWSELPFRPPGELSDPLIETLFPTLQADSFTTELAEKPNRMLEKVLHSVIWGRISRCGVFLWTWFSQEAEAILRLNILILFSCSVLSALWKPMDCSLLCSSVHGILQDEYWSVLPCPSPGDVPNPGTEPTSLISPALAGRFFTTSTTYEAHLLSILTHKWKCSWFCTYNFILRNPYVPICFIL